MVLLTGCRNDASFSVTSRRDGLLLRHWRKALDDALPTDCLTDSAVAHRPTPTEEDMNIDEQLRKSREKAIIRMDQNTKARASRVSEQPTIETYKFDKYNIHAESPPYDDQLYDRYLTTTDWSREETDYLMNLYTECYGKWHVISDRYEFKRQSQEGSDILSVEMDNYINNNTRTMEELKARFYGVSAKVIAAKTPLSNMTTTEFANHEKMTKFDPAHEKERKRQKAALLERSKAEREEERLLLIELQRIYNRRHTLEVEGRDLRSRLDHSLTDDITGAALYTSSQEINGLLQKMLQKERNTKLMQQRRMQERGEIIQSPSGAQAGVHVHGGMASRDSKRASLVAGPTAARQHMNEATCQRFGVKALERLPVGVTFKSDRCAKARVAKSASKTEKIGVVLAELGVPEALQMPTDDVTKALEMLSARVGELLDKRRLLEKEQSELRIELEKKALDSKELGKGRTTAHAEIVGNRDDADVEADVSVEDTYVPVHGEGDDEDAAGEEGENQADDDGSEGGDDETDVKGDLAPSPSVHLSKRDQTARGNKRSLSVLSASSVGSGRSRATSKRRKI